MDIITCVYNYALIGG